MENNKAVLIVSLDFELYWGMRDLKSISEYRRRAANVRPAVSAILDLFKAYLVHATWATVGFLFLKNRKELLHALPCVKPAYIEQKLSPYCDLNTIGESEEDEPCCYASSIVQKIRETPYQEVGTHTFSHYYCLEQGQTLAAFDNDLSAAVEAANHHGIQLQSLVFPRNQVNLSYLESCRAHGITSYRGAGSHWIYKPRNRSAESLPRRVCRVIDCFIGVFGHHCIPLDAIAQQSPPFDFRGTRHLRPALMIGKPFERQALRRIYKGLDFAAKYGNMYHLWFHPEEFSTNLDQKIDMLRRILDHFASLRASGWMETMNMGELAEKLMEGRREQALAECSSLIR